MMLLLGLALIFLVFVVWLVFTAFTLEDPALTMHQDENWYEDETDLLRMRTDLLRIGNNHVF